MSGLGVAGLSVELDHVPVLHAVSAAVPGAGFLVLADTLARTVVSPAELPIGVVTALVGSPVFVWILRSTAAVRT